ncbi:MAG: peptide chain release factor N(5)-glutamine methyltransferase [Moraxella sp.]|nr:peptide chain release factor N(5)-glutamine methyltransferase [Moraxella sp.]
MTIKELKVYFRQIANERLPRHWLDGWLKFVLKQDDVFLMVHDDYEPNDDELTRLHDGIRQMQQGIPLGYLLGYQGFFGHEFVINRHTLIPRADTELLVQSVLDVVGVRGLRSGRILDMGTGSGCIAISLDRALSNISADFGVVACDVSEQALVVAKQNNQRLGANCTFVQSNWYDNITGRFDFIVSNPPYIDKADEHLQDLKVEPMTALVADDGGLADIKLIAKSSQDYLNPNGVLMVEHGHTQGGAVRDIFTEVGLSGVHTIQDYGGNDRVTMGVCRG